MGHQHPGSTIEFKQGGTIDFTGAIYVDDPKLKFKLTDHLPRWAEFSTVPDRNTKHINPS